MKSLMISALIACSVSIPVIAETLLEVDRGMTPGRVYIDTDSIERSGDEVYFFYVLDVYAAHRNKKGLRVYGEHELRPIEYYKSNKVELIFHCRTRQAKTLSVQAYDKAAAQGSRVGYHTVLPKDQKWEKIHDSDRDTYNMLFPHVCGIE
jgi:hypothetical protein